MTAQTVVGVEVTSEDDATSATVGAGRASSAGGATRFVLQVVAWLVIVATLGVLVIAVAAPRIGGATPYTVLTGSMRPTYPPGTLVVAKPVEASAIKIGDVITFQLESGQEEVVTHRVIGVRAGDDGEPEFLTQGDANGAPDADPVRSVQVQGKLWYAAPHLGRVNTLLSGHQRQLAVYGFAGALVLYAGAMFAGALRERRRTTR